MRLEDLLKQYKSVKPDPAWERKSREMLLERFRETFAQEKSSSDFYPFFKRAWGLNLRPVAVSLLVLFVFIGGFGTICLAKNTFPGHFLYPVKRTVEKARLNFAFSQGKKAVLRAEILTNRLSEVKILAERAAERGEEVNLRLGELTQNFQDELKVLKKEVIAQSGFEPEQELSPPEIDVTFDQGSLPVQDQREVFTVLQTEDLKKLLEETKNLLAEKNMKMALERINDAEKIVLERNPDLDEELKSPIEEEILLDQTTSTESEIESQSRVKPIIENEAGSLGALTKPDPKADPDFEIPALQRTEKEFKADMILEK